MGYRSKRLRDFARGAAASRALLERERWPRERLEDYQRQRLDELARFLRARSRFWRERLPAGRVELAALPITTKADLIEGFDEMVTDRRLRLADLLAHLDRIDDDALYLGEYRVLASSGSSGRKSVFVYDRPAWIGVLTMFLRRSVWTGATPRLPRLRLAMVGGGAPAHMTRRGAQSLDVGVHRVLGLAVTQPLGEVVGGLNRFRPQHLYTYPSMAALLADEQRAGRLRLRLEALFMSSEPLQPQLRERLADAFGVRPYNFYATTEGLWGHDCAERSLHMFDDMCIVENVDDEGRPVARGEIGSRLLVTNLFNRALPLIRFEVSDLIAVEPEPCRCGRSLLRVRSVEGRAEEVLSVDGVAVHPLQFGIVTADPAVREFQVVQEGDALRLRVALRGDASAAPRRLRERLSRRLAELGVASPTVRVEVVDALERTAGGKLTMIVPDRSRTGAGEAIGAGGVRA